MVQSFDSSGDEAVLYGRLTESANRLERVEVQPCSQGTEFPTHNTGIKGQIADRRTGVGED